ncbi:MAG: MtrB/PioB family decaheme-associated outer membrane protein [Deltaproteobacteria bacterium]|nr:MtrB/PioB family decaheme-associated outer membrane protein [Deltaproteobacteria bacterium]
MRFQKKLLTALTLLSIILGMRTISIGADTDGYIEAGAMTVDQRPESSKFMEYRGIDEDGTFPIANFNALYDTESHYFLDFTGKNLGIDTRNVYLKGGKYGLFKYFLEYDQIEQFISNNSRTLFTNPGSSDLTLPSGYNRNVVAKTTVDTILNGASGIGGTGNLKDIDMRLERKVGKAGFSFTPFDNITFDFSYKREQKEGVKAIGALNGGVANIVILPQPVDYITDTLRAAARYDTESTHTEFEYYLSKFNNQDVSLRWENPYNSGSTTDPHQVRSALPDTIYHRFSLSENMKLPWWHTSLSLAASYGIMLQDQAFLPYHAVSSATVNGSTNPLPRQSPDAEVDVISLNANIASRPSSNLGLSAKFIHYETVNKTPSSLYRYVAADGTPTTAVPGLSSAQSVNNLPYDIIKNQVKLDATDLLLPSQNTTLSMGYEFEKIERDHRESDTAENIGKIGLRSDLTSFAQAGANGLYGKREALNYNGRVVLELHPPEYEQCITTTSPAGCGVTSLANARNWFNHPDVRKADVSDRERYQYNGFLNIFPHYNVTVGIDYSNTMDDFYNTLLGVQKRNNEIYTINTTYSPFDALSLYAYYTNERNDSQQAGRQISATATTWYNPALDWRMDIRDVSNTAGVGLNILLLNDRLIVTPDFIYERTTTAYTAFAGSSFNGSSADLLPAKTIPNLKTKRYTVDMSGKYKLTDHWTVRAGYIYESFKSDDWAMDDITLNNTASVPNALFILSESIHDYIAHVGSVAIAYNW